MDTWLPLRRSLPRWGGVLFPPDLTRRQKTVAVPELMDASTVYRRVHRFLVNCGVTGTRLAPQTLRNTFAAMRIEEGWDDALIMASMALFDEVTVPRMRNEHTRWESETLLGS